MSVTEFRFDPGQILQPVFPSPPPRLAPCAFGASLTIAKGQAVGRKTSDSKMYPLNPDASDGTQTFAGFSQYPLVTDASGVVYGVYGSGAAAGANYFALPNSYSAIYTAGMFDPADLSTSLATGTPTAEVDTITPTNPTTGDIYTVTNASGDVLASFTVGATQTATATVTGLAASWNANTQAKALATTSGTATFILTGVTKGQALNLSAGVSGTGTTALVVTTPAVSATQGEKDTWTFAGTIATADVYTATLTYPNGTTRAVSFTVGATATAAAVDAGLIAAWNADPYLSLVATASGTSTFILTNTSAGGSQSVAIASTGAGTVTKVVTLAAFGRSIADILPGAPGSHVDQATGFWVVM